MISILLHLLRADLAIFWRAKLALFWTFALPLLLLVMQMALFGQDIKLGPLSLALVDLDRSNASSAYLHQLQTGLQQQRSVAFAPVTVVAEGGAGATATAMQADMVLTIPSGFAANIAAGRSTEITVQGRNAHGAAFDAAYGLLRGYSDRYNLSGLQGPQRVRLAEPLRGAEQRLDYRLFLVTGLAGMVILSTSLMGFAAPLVAAREGGMFRIYQLFPMPTAVVVGAWWLSRLLIVLLASAALFLFAWLMYGVRIDAGAVAVVAAVSMLALGAAAFLALGVLIAALVDSVAGATIVCNVLYFPLLFSGSLMVPLGGLPPLARRVLDCLPLNALMASVRRCLSGSMDWHAELYSVSVLLAMLLAALTLAARRFSWMPRA